MELGTIIRNRRLELGLTLEKVGEAVGVGKSTVRKWESGQIKDMRRDKISALSKVLRISPVVFIFDDESEYNNFDNHGVTKQPDDLYTMVQQLDLEDRAEIRGTVKQMLKADKYKEKRSRLA